MECILTWQAFTFYVNKCRELSTTVLLWHGFTWYVNHCHVQTQRERRKTLPCISRGKRYVNLCHVSACNQYQNLRKLLYDQRREFSNQRLRSSLNYRWRRTVTHRRTHDYEYVAPTLPDYLTPLIWVLGFRCLRWLQIQPQSMQIPGGACPQTPLPNCSLAPPPLWQ